MLIKILGKEKKGQALIELLVGFAILTIVLTSVTLLVIGAREASTRSANILEAENSLVFQNEALRSVRESGWSNLQNGTYHLVSSGGAWALASNSETVNGFERQIVIDDTCRDTGGSLVDCPSGTTDPSTKKLTSSVTWQHFFGGKVDDIFYFTRHLNNDTWVQTTQADFDLGSFTNTESTPAGDVRLLRTGGWDNPGPLTAPGSFYDNPGNQDAFDIDVFNNHAFLVTGSSGTDPDLAIVNVADPVSIFEVGTLNLDARVNGIAVEDDSSEGHFSYLSTASDTKELIVVDISNKAVPIETASLDLGNNRDALDVSISGSGREKFAYVGKQSAGGSNRELYVISINTCFDVTGDNSVDTLDILDIADHTGDPSPSIYDLNANNVVDVEDTNLAISRFLLSCPHAPNPNIVGEFEVGGGSANANAVNQIFAVGNKVYLATSRNDKELIVVNVTNKTSPTEIGSGSSYNTPSGANANDIFVSGSNGYLVTQNNGAGEEFYILDVSDPENISLSSPSPPSTYNVGSGANGVWVSNDLAFIASDINSKEFIVLDISNIGSIIELSSVDLPTAGSDSNKLYLSGNFVFLATDHQNRELQIIGSGLGSSFHSSGTYESQSFDCTIPTPTASEICSGNTAGYNFLTWSEQLSANTDILFQIATNDDDSSWNYVGPDGTSSTFYENPGGAIPLSEVERRYFRFKATLFTDGNNTPILRDVTVNYSP